MTPAWRGRGTAGFTLVETLVALLVFAVVAVVAQRGMVTSRLGLDRVQSTLAAEQAARSILETQLDLLVKGPGEFTGQADGLDWQIVASPLPVPAPPPPQTRPGAPAPSAQPGQSGQQPAGGTTVAQKSDDVDEENWRVLRVVLTIVNGRGRPLRFETLHNIKIEQ